MIHLMIGYGVAVEFRKEGLTFSSGDDPIRYCTSCDAFAQFGCSMVMERHALSKTLYHILPLGGTTLDRKDIC